MLTLALGGGLSSFLWSLNSHAGVLPFCPTLVGSQEFSQRPQLEQYLEFAGSVVFMLMVQEKR